MKIAVTGATGFIGRHVLAELEARSVETIAIVRASTARPLGHSGSSVVQLDLHDPPSNAFEFMDRPDALIHLAWSGLPNYSSLHHFEEELPAHYRFLKQLIESGLQNIVVAGTCFEYGMQSGALSEDTAPLPSNPYGFAKNALRSQLTFLGATHPFQLTWARLFYLYGEGQVGSALLPQLRQAVERGDEVFNMSGGKQQRDYLRVEEAAGFLVSLARTKKNIGTVNVCSGTPVSVRKLVEGWIKENGWPITPNLGHYPYPDYEPMAFWGNPEKLHSLIGKTT
jgi:dTDP-6-deoxy-L-talose 4-dehydrogenase (NAD+)